MRRFWRSRWLHFGFWLALIFGLSSIPDLTPPGPKVSGIDKLFHAGEYALLGLFWGRALGARRHAFWLGALLGLCVGVLDELHQGRVPGREMDAVDAAADCLGAALGSHAWTWWARRQRAMAEPAAGVTGDEGP